MIWTCKKIETNYKVQIHKINRVITHKKEVHVSELDFRKQLLINEFKSMSKGKNKDEILPLMLAISSKAKQAGISFTKEDMLLIIDQVKDELSEQEKKISPELLLLMERL